jgi:hypothetical protein
MKMMNAGILKNQVLTEDQMETVSGGGLAIGVGTAIAAVSLFAGGANGLGKELRDTVHSFSYAQMSDEDKEKAIGKVLANSIAFAMAVQASGDLAWGTVTLIRTQIQYRTVGVGTDVREFIEKHF